MADADLNTPSEDPRGQWPGIAPAQVYVMPSYQWTVARYEAADSRIQTLLTFVATVTFAVPTLGRAIRSDLPLRSPWFFGAVWVAAAIVVLGLVARLRGSLILPAPAMLYDKWLAFSDGEFQKNALYFAGKHFETNRVTINRKANAVAVMGVLFACELALFLTWVVSA